MAAIIRHPFEKVDAKRCPKCNELRILEDFSANKSQSSGSSYTCRYCVNHANAERRHRKESSSAILVDSKTLDRELKNELKEVWDE